MKEELPKGFAKTVKSEASKDGAEVKAAVAEEEGTSGKGEGSSVKGEGSEKGEETSSVGVSEPPSEGNVATAAAAGLASAAVKAKVG